ncbi:MAG: PorP/SprF family type IX secretion system membrane protein [Bacteroidia bacterium]
MNKFWITFLVLIACSASAFGQTFIQNTMYDQNRFVYNPATAGQDDKGTSSAWSMMLLGRLQWAGIDGSPQLASLSAHRGFDFGGIGAYVMRDGVGPLSSTSINVSYASNPISLPGESSLSLGLSVGISQRAINMTVLSVDPDPILPDIGTLLSGSVTAPNLSLGITYRKLTDGFEQLFVGVSGHDLTEPSISDLVLSSINGNVSNVPRSFYLQASYRIPIGNWTSLTYNYVQPSVMVRTQGAVLQTDVSLKAKYSALHAGFNYRGLAFAGGNSESVGGILGFEVDDANRWFFGYSFDYNLTGLNINGGASSHEIVISYKIGGGRKSGNVVKPGDVIKKN